MLGQGAFSEAQLLRIKISVFKCLISHSVKKEVKMSRRTPEMFAEFLKQSLPLRIVVMFWLTANIPLFSFIAESRIILTELSLCIQVNVCY